MQVLVSLRINAQRIKQNHILNDVRNQLTTVLCECDLVFAVADNLYEVVAVIVPTRQELLFGICFALQDQSSQKIVEDIRLRPEKCAVTLADIIDVRDGQLDPKFFRTLQREAQATAFQMPRLPVSGVIGSPITTRPRP